MYHDTLSIQFVYPSWRVVVQEVTHIRAMSRAQIERRVHYAACVCVLVPWRRYADLRRRGRRGEMAAEGKLLVRMLYAMARYVAFQKRYFALKHSQTNTNTH